MKKLAIISPGILPVPAINGGAVETLITYLIEGNEKKHCFDITLFSCANNKLNNVIYHNTILVQEKKSKLNRMIFLITYVIKKYFNIGRTISSYQMFLARINWSQYDYILVENSMACYETLYFSRGTRGKLFFHLHNDLENKDGDKTEKRTKLIIKSANKIITVSQFLKTRIQNIMQTNKTCVLLNCINFKNFDRSLQDEIGIKRQYKISEDDFVVMYSGRIVPEKGVLELCKAILNLIKKYNNLKLLIVGNTEISEPLEKKYFQTILSVIKKYEKNFIFTGYIDQADIPYYYSISNIVVLPTKINEAFGLSALEAMYVGKPVIVTNSGGLTEFVNEENGFIIDNSQNLQSEIEEKIYYAISHKDVIEKMGEKARKYIMNNTNFDSNKYFENFCKILQ